MTKRKRQRTPATEACSALHVGHPSMLCGIGPGTYLDMGADTFTAQMDQMVVWEHVLCFLDVGRKGAMHSHVAAVSPGIRRVRDAVAMPAACSEAVVLLWWLRRQPHVKVEHTCYNEDGGRACINAFVQLPGRLDLSFRHSVSNSTLALLRGPTQLQTLAFSLNWTTTDAGLAHLRGLSQLQGLTLSGCYLITDAGVAHLRGLSQLQRLTLSGCSLITDAGVAHLQGLTQLQTLRVLGSSHITCAGLAYLRGHKTLHTLYF